jgi:hypothetical protein
MGVLEGRGDIGKSSSPLNKEEKLFISPGS